MVTTKNPNGGNQATSSNQATAQTTGQAGNAVLNSYTEAETQSKSSLSQTQSTNSSFQIQSGAMQGSNQAVKSVIGVFSSRNNAEQAVNALRAQGFTTEEINIVSKNKSNQGQQGTEYFEDDITDGALTGGTLGGIGGLLLGAGALAIPGVGPILAAGPIAAALSGAVAGGIAGGLIDWGIPAEAGKRYEQQVAQGGILAIIRSDAVKVNQAAQVLRQNGAKDVETHAVK
ncbi:MAG: hypothetical protein K0R55_2867 [Sporomusa sp.]|jgi:hypothetical protein|nr:hypothetical protein [Sporomusa sp.]